MILQALVHDIHVICGCLKDFLRGLKEPLITFRLWNVFVGAVGELCFIVSNVTSIETIISLLACTALNQSLYLL